MDDGRSRIWGSSKCCQESKVFFLEANEEIVKLETWHEQTLCGLVICTNRNRTSLYGSAKGLSQEFIGSWNHYIAGIVIETNGSLFRITGVELLPHPILCSIDSEKQVYALLITHWPLTKFNLKKKITREIPSYVM
jgi:hypothetical protein